MLTRTTKEAVGAGALCKVGLLAAMLAGLLVLQPAAGQDTDAVTVEVGRCIELDSAEARLACFDAQVGGVLDERSTAEPSEPSPSIDNADPSRNQPERDAVLTRQAQRVERATARPTANVPPRRAEAEPEAPDEYFGTVVTLRERLPNAHVITLDNGQIWEQVEPKLYPLRPGLEVRIYPTKWGDAYRLNGQGTGGHIKVRRVR